MARQDTAFDRLADAVEAVLDMEWLEGVMWDDTRRYNL